MSKVSREEIIAAAVRLFFQNGYHATSMQDVAHEVAIKKPSLYHHFESKEAILLAILETGMDKLLADLKSIAASDDDSATKLREAIRAHAVSIAAYPEAAAIFFREDRGLGSGYIDHYIAKRDLFEEAFRTIVNQGVSAGQFRSTDIPITVQAILGMVNWMTRWYRPDGRLKAEQIADSFADMVLSGLVQAD
jgi:AcrR family transcriptional regulator